MSIPTGTRELPHRENKAEQFAWWSKHWSTIINDEQVCVCVCVCVCVRMLMRERLCVSERERE